VNTDIQHKMFKDQPIPAAICITTDAALETGPNAVSPKCRDAAAAPDAGDNLNRLVIMAEAAYSVQVFLARK